MPRGLVERLQESGAEMVTPQWLEECHRTKTLVATGPYSVLNPEP